MSPKEMMKVRLRVQGPRWIEAHRVDLYLNGEKVASRPLSPRADAIVKGDLTLSLPRPRHDGWLVAIASATAAPVASNPGG